MVYYNGQHSITFINPLCGSIENGLYPERNYTKNTWKDWGLIPSNKPVISYPKRKTNMLEILGRDGSKDISFDFFKKPVFSNREGSINFIIANNDLDSFRKYKDFNDVYFEIATFFSFGKTYMILDDEKDFYYEGYFSVDEIKSDENYPTIKISYSLLPYKWTINNSIDEWLWDPFNLHNGIISKIVSASQNGLQTFEIKYQESGLHVLKKRFVYAVRLGSLIRIALSLKKDPDFTLNTFIYNNPNGENRGDPTRGHNSVIIPGLLKTGKNIFYFYVTPDMEISENSSNKGYSGFNLLNNNNIFNDLYIDLNFWTEEYTDNECTIYIEEGCI